MRPRELSSVTARPDGSSLAVEPTLEGRTPVRLNLLGPLRVWRDGVEISAGPPQQANLLALLLAREGRPIGTDELVDLMWGKDAPVTAVNVIHKYVGGLRRLLEPTLRTRGAGSYILRRGAGYLCAAGPGALDLVDFRELVNSARVQLEENRHPAALDLYLEALALWRGPAGEGMAHSPAAEPIFAHLNDEYLDASVTAARLAVELGEPERVLKPLHLAAAMAPFHEPVQASLITALGAAGQQAAALSIYQSLRTQLAEELGIDPGSALEAAHRRVLRREPAPSRGGNDTTSPRAPVPATSATSPGSVLVGRADELAALRHALQQARSGTAGVVLIEGEPGVGKTRLLEEADIEARTKNDLVVWSYCLEGDGTPSMWPWTQIVDTIIRRQVLEDRNSWLSSDLGRLTTLHQDTDLATNKLDGNAQFRLAEAVVALLEAASEKRPLVLIIDDLQWADAASLELLAYVASHLPDGTTLFGALRDRAPTPSEPLSKALAAISRTPSHRRLTLGPLSLPEVTELVRRETGHEPAPNAVRSVLARTDGNPLFVRELTRLLARGGQLTDAAAAEPAVPATVRDVVLDLLSRLDEDVQEILRLAALIGRHVDLWLLSRAADLDIHACLYRLEQVENLGFLVSAADDPFSRRFAHDLVRESVSAAMSPQHAARLHLRIATALQTETTDETTTEQLAHHLWSAGPLSDPTATANALLRSGARAARKTAVVAAERQLRAAVKVARAASLPNLEFAAMSELIFVVQMSSPHGQETIELQERAESLAYTTGHHEEAAVLMYTRWMAYAFGGQHKQSAALARQLLDQGTTSPDPVARALGLQAWGLYQVSNGNNREGLRLLNEARASYLLVPAHRQADAFWRNQQLSALGMLAETTAASGDIAAARALLDELEIIADDDPYEVTIWAGHSVRTSTIIGDPAWTLTVTRKGIAADPSLSFGFLGVYQRLAQLWALAVTGHDPSASAAEADQLITEHLLDPPRMSVATWCGLLAEMYLSADEPAQAAAALDRANWALDTFGQKFVEGLLLFIRARLLQAQGRPYGEVRAAAQTARELSVARGADLFAHRADDFLATLTKHSLGAGGADGGVGPGPDRVGLRD